jgi:hypothetical protein
MSCSFNKDDSPCGAVYFAPEHKTIVPLQSLNDDISGYMRSLRVNTEKQTGQLQEWELICNRGGIVRDDAEELQRLTVCPKHRNDLGRNWTAARQKICKHPNHEGKKRTLTNPRRVNQLMSQQIYIIHNAIVPIGSGKLACNFSLNSVVFLYT